MAFATSVGYPPVVWSLDLTWPWSYAEAAGAAAPIDQALNSAAAGWLSTNTTATIGRGISSIAIGGAGVTDRLVVYRGARAAEVATVGAAYANQYGLAPVMPIIRGALNGDAGAIVPAWRRGFWLQWCVAIGAGGAPNNQCGLALVGSPNSAGTARWPIGTPAGQQGNGSIGFFGDGAGGWRFRCYDDAVPPSNVLLDVAVPAAAGANEYQTLEMFITSAGSGRAATIDVWADGVQIAQGIQFTSAAGGALDPWASGGDRLILILRQATVGGGSIFTEHWRARWGPFTRDGVPIP